MAQLNDLLVLGNASLVGDVNLSSNLNISGETTSLKFIGPLEGNATSADAAPWSGISNKPSYYDAKAIKSITRSGTTFTATHMDGTTTTFTQRDNNTTYSAGTGLSLSGTTFNHKNSVTASTAKGSDTKTLTFGGTFALPTVSYDAQGHVTGSGTTTMTMPSDRLFTMLVPTGTAIPLNADLKTTTYLKVGRYYCSANDTAKTLKNCPTNLAFMMEVYSPLSTTIDNETTSKYVYRLRKITEYRTGVQYIQYVGSGATAGTFTYEDWYVIPRTKFTLDTTDTNDGTAATGSTTKPVYIDADGTITAGSTYAGGTKVTLNNSDKGASTATIYAPTVGGTSNYVLVGQGATSAPTWTAQSNLTAGYASKLTDITTGDIASSSATQRYVFISYNDLTTNRPAYDTNFTYQTSTGTLTAPQYSGEKITLNNTADSKGIILKRTTTDDEVLKIRVDGNNGVLHNINETKKSVLKFVLEYTDTSNGGAGKNSKEITFTHENKITSITADKFLGQSTNVLISKGSSDVERPVVLTNPTAESNAQNLYYANDVTVNYSKKTVTAPGGFKGNADSATKLYVTKTISASTQYFPMFISGFESGKTSGNKDAYIHPRYYYWDTGARAHLCIGEQGTSTTDATGAYSGGITISSGSGKGKYVDIIPAKMSQYNQITIPDESGTLALRERDNTFTGFNTFTKGISIGSSKQADTTAPQAGITIHDLRNVTPAGGMFGEKRLNFYFDQVTDKFGGATANSTRWMSIMHMSGWTNTYASWELAGNAQNDSTEDTLRYRQGIGTNWGAWQSVLTDANYHIYADGRYVNVTGDTMTGNLNLKGTNPYLGFANSSGTVVGYAQYVQSGNYYAFGAGEANSIKVDATGNVSIPASKTFTPRTTNTGSVGTSDAKWNAMYATTFYGALSGNASSATKATQDGSGNTITSTYLKLSGGTMTGVLTAKGGMYEDAYNGALNMNNSDIYGVNSIYTADLSDSPAEGIHFYRTSTTVDTLSIKNGVFSFVPNRTLGSNGTSQTVLHTGNSGGVFYVTGNSGGTAGTWTGSNTNIPRMYTGLTIAYKILTAGASTTTLNLTTAAGASGAITVKRANGNLTTHLAVNSVIVLVYDGTYWRWADYSTADTKNTTGTTNSTSILYLAGGTSQAANPQTYSNSAIKANCNSAGTNEAGSLTATKVYGAIWNDYAEYRNQVDYVEPGYCIASTDDGRVYKTTEKFQACDGIVSDTFGFSIGETLTCKTPIAVAGRVLAYCEGDRYDYHAGDTVCAGPEGKVCKMTREEICKYPDRIIGIVSEIPMYDEWGTGNIKVNNRIWIKIK